MQLSWDIGVGEASRLVTFLKGEGDEPSLDAKAQFLAHENRIIHSEILGLNEQRRAGYQFLFVLVGAYFAYTVAPFRLFDEMSVEVSLFYAIGGIWVSVMLVFHCMRFTDFLSTSVRRRTYLYKAIAGNRGWIFAQDPAYFGKSVLPLDSQFDSLRAWTSPTRNDIEVHSAWLKYNKSATIFLFFLQALFVIGFVYFFSLLIRGYELSEVSGIRILPPPRGETSGLDLFKGESFRHSMVLLAVLLLGWVQIFSEKCIRMQKRIWEARLISSGRPNPRFPDLAFQDQRPGSHRLGRLLIRAVLGLGLLMGLLLLLQKFGTFDSVAMSWLPDQVLVVIGWLTDWVLVLVLILILLVGKIIHGKAVIHAANLEERLAHPIRS